MLAAPRCARPESSAPSAAPECFPPRARRRENGGRVAIYPLLEEIVQNLPQHKMILGTGAGTRARHAYAEGLDLGMPTGVLSVLGFLVSLQNARMLGYLLAKHGIPMIEAARAPRGGFYRLAAVFLLAA